MNRWEHFWFRPGEAINLIAARAILAVHALWLVLSRPDLPAIASWPEAFWIHADGFVRARFLIVPLPHAIEMALYVTLAMTLALTALGRAMPAAPFAAALLIYHFAPFEDIFASSGGPFFRGFTTPATCLVVIACAKTPRRHDPPSPESRWPLALVQLLLAFTYLMSGLSKLRLVGPRWATAQNFEGIVLSMMFPDVVPPLSHWFIGHPLLCWAGALTGVAMDLLFISAVLSPRAARWIVPLALLTHLLAIGVLGVVFLAAPTLLIFVNWSWVFSRGPTRAAAQATSSAA